MVDYIIGRALHLGASDIHISINQVQDPQLQYLLRLRIHGKLQLLRAEFLARHYKEVISRFKVLAGMDITENMIPQDGQLEVVTPEQKHIVLRIATVPGSEHEDLVIRVQKSGNQNLTIKNLQMTRSLRQKLEELIQQKSGLVILNGPAGSGKTTTIYSILGTLAGPDRKVITAEDPIEARLPFVGHTQVNPKTNFASLARAFMRQDAEVIFIGEIRDRESAEAAIQLAQTGHLVLTTLHTRDSIGVISRLEALEIHPNMISTTLIASLSQRLIPVLCPDCRVAYTPSQKRLYALHMVLPPPMENATYYQPGPGCKKCVAGTQGRMPIFELFVADPALSEMIDRGASKAEIVKVARGKGMRTLAEDAAMKVYEGVADVNAIYGYLAGPSYEGSRSDLPVAAAAHAPRAITPVADPEGSHVLTLETAQQTATGQSRANVAAAPAQPPAARPAMQSRPLTGLSPAPANTAVPGQTRTQAAQPAAPVTRPLKKASGE
jgi:type II secretory ATPase GspE/PulE/Tfp pilus assembly ATPase PilB-like protein